MADLNLFSDVEESGWLEALPSYQKEIVSELLASKSHEEAALAWLEASVDNTSPFTGQPQPEKKFLPLLKKEIHKLLCGNPEYAADRNELAQLTQTKENKTAIVSMVSAVIGAKVGLAATFIAPAIVIIFLMIAKTSLNAWCALETSEN
ncbi:hypothetical protein G4D61_15840 [Bacillus ginsengihumi]|uniref:Transmembrane protein n=1 Tax=Heyndrickxia ginsengihumi TaxID=363870 RepID=A0A6M0PAM5_9BACI|nr:hypothetical protein [Heyndrickxia ginsengihumi]NEY21415.1 hypothetical protein [Heyndrickxia ginsengihumi]